MKFYKIYYSILFLFIFTVGAFSSDWILIFTNEIREVYIDTKSINIDKEKRKSVLKTILKKENNFHPKSDKYWTKYFISVYNFDCKKRIFQIVSRKYYDSNGIENPKIKTEKDWNKIQPGKKTEKFYEYVCNYLPE